MDANEAARKVKRIVGINGVVFNARKISDPSIAYRVGENKNGHIKQLGYGSSWEEALDQAMRRVKEKKPWQKNRSHRNPGTR